MNIGALVPSATWAARAAAALAFVALLAFIRYQSGLIEDQAGRIERQAGRLGEATAANAGLAAANETLRAEQARLNTLLEGWSRDRQTLAQTREAVRRAVREAFIDADFASWSGGALPASVLPGNGLLGAGGDRPGPGAHPADAAGGAGAGNAGPALDGRDQR